MTEETIELATADGPMVAAVGRPSGEPRGALIVIPEAFGLNDHIADIAGRCATAGYLGLSLDIFHRTGRRMVAGYNDFRSVQTLFTGLTDEGLLVDVDAALAQLEKEGIAASRVGIVGFCFGGRVAFLVAANRRLGAAISFYGGGIVSQGFFPAFPPLLDTVDQMQTPWLGLFGDLDRSIPVEEVERLRSTLTSTAPVPIEVVRYPAADHGFHCDARPSYHAVSAADAWTRTISFVERHLR